MFVKVRVNFVVLLLSVVDVWSYMWLCDNGWCFFVMLSDLFMNDYEMGYVKWKCMYIIECVWFVIV